MHYVSNQVYLFFIAVYSTAVSVCDGLYSSTTVQLQQGDCTDAAEVLRVVPLCVLSSSYQDGYRCGCKGLLLPEVISCWICLCELQSMLLRRYWTWSAMSSATRLLVAAPTDVVA